MDGLFWWKRKQEAMPAVLCSSFQFPVLAPVHVRQAYNSTDLHCLPLKFMSLKVRFGDSKWGEKSPCQLFWAGLERYITIFSTDCLCSSATLSAQYFKVAHMSKSHLQLP